MNKSKSVKNKLEHILYLSVIIVIWFSFGKLTSFSFNIRILSLILFQSTLLLYVLINNIERKKISDYFKIHFKKSDIWWGLIAALFNILLALIIAPLLPNHNSIVDKIPQKISLIYIMMIFSIVFWGPLVEEILFRGFIWKILEKNKINGKYILLITSLLFSFYHFELIRIPMLLVSGLIYGYSRYKTDRMGIAIVGHMINNTLILILS